MKILHAIPSYIQGYFNIKNNSPPSKNKQTNKQNLGKIVFLQDVPYLFCGSLNPEA